MSRFNFCMSIANIESVQEERGKQQNIGRDMNIGETR